MRRDPARLEGDARELARIQRGLQRLLIAPATTASAEAEAARAIGCAAGPIALYRGMIALRLAREVAREFPATRALLGQAGFAAEARAFVRAQASASHSLDGYARAFPQHLLRAKGVASGAAELARLEREIARVRAARAPSARSWRAHSAGPRLEPAPGARVLRFAYDVDAVLACFERRGATRPPRRRAVHIALFRRGASVLRLRLAQSGALLLGALVRGEALEHAVARAVDRGITPAAIGRALERGVGEGILIAV